MANTAYARDDNEEIYVRSLNVSNPAPDLLQVRMADSGQIFYARPSVVVKGIYSDLDSLSAFSQTNTASYYLVYNRDKASASAIILELIQGSAEETFDVRSYGALPKHEQDLVPPEFIRF